MSLIGVYLEHGRNGDLGRCLGTKGIKVQQPVTLFGRTPLYRLDEFIQDQDTELLLGKRINPESSFSVLR